MKFRVKPSCSFDFPLKIKEEPSDAPLMKNDDEMADVKHFPFFEFPLTNSTLQELNENRASELDNLAIEFECRDAKPTTDLLAVTKVEDCIQNRWQNKEDENSHRTRNEINSDTLRAVKEEPFVDDAKQSIGHGLGTGIDNVCEICRKTFSSKSNLRTHVVSVHNGVSHTCDICDKKFTSKRNLKCHIDAVHIGVTHACDVCQKTFARKDSLKIHIVSVHIGVTHACDMCGKKFARKTHLKAHMNGVHIGVTHACIVCGKTFANKSNLNKHISAVHNDVRHACNICGKKFTSKHYLKIHINAEHIRARYYLSMQCM